MAPGWCISSMESLSKTDLAIETALRVDKAYDQIDVYQAAIDRGSIDIKLLINPRTDAVIWSSNRDALRQRDVHVKSMKEDGVLA